MGSAEGSSGSPPGGGRREKRLWDHSATLGGKHIYTTKTGVKLYIVQRRNSLMARGRYQGRQFAKTLGTTEEDALQELYALIAALNEGRFFFPGDLRTRELPTRSFSQLLLADVVADFLAEKRKLKGAETAATYTGRLRHLLAFLELPVVRKKWPYACSVDGEFVQDFQHWLHDRQVTRNGRPGSTPKPIFSRGIYLALETLRNLLHWAAQPRVGRLRPDFVNPVTRDVLGERPRKDPLRECVFSLEDRIKLIESANSWELCVLAPSVVLPPRAEEITGLLVSEVDFGRRRLRFATRMGGDDYTKGKTDFVVPFPAELDPVFRSLQAGRAEGPMLRKRTHQYGASSGAFVDHAAFSRAYAEWLASIPKESVMTRADRKAAFRKFLALQGALSPDGLKKAFDALQRRAFGRIKGRLHDLRHAATDGMDKSGVTDQARRYMTSHACSDILDAYTTVDLDREAAKYFASIRPLLDAVSARTRELGLNDPEDAA